MRAPAGHPKRVVESAPIKPTRAILHKHLFFISISYSIFTPLTKTPGIRLSPRNAEEIPTAPIFCYIADWAFYFAFCTRPMGAVVR